MIKILPDFYLIRTYSWLLIFLISLPAWCQSPRYTNAQRYDVEDGLPQSYVTGIQQDQDGFIWVSTLDGLARFDGRKFLTFRKELSDTNSLSLSRIRTIHLDTRNQLWLRYHDGGIDRMDLRTFKITRNPRPYLLKNFIANGFDGPPNYFFKDPSGNWVDNRVEKMLALYDTTNSPLYRIDQKKSYVQKERINFLSFCEDSAGNFWVLNTEGLISFDSLGNATEEYLWENKGLVNRYSIGRQIVMFQEDNDLILGINGLMKFDLSEKRFKRNDWQFAEKEGDPVSFTRDQDGQLILAFKKNLFLMKGNQMRCLWSVPDSFSISTIFVDQSNTLWIGMDAGGLYRLNLSSTSFNSFAYKRNFITDILVDHLNVGLKQAEDFQFTKPLNSYYARYFYMDSLNLILSLENQLPLPKNVAIMKWNKNSIEPVGLTTNTVDAIAKGPRNEAILLDVHGQLLRWKEFNQPAVIQQLKIPVRIHSRIVDMVADTRSVWLGSTNDGIFEIQDGSVVDSISLHPGYALNTMINDPWDSTLLWVGSIGGGLFKWSKEKREILKVYNTSNGLPNNVINAIVPDSLGHFWVSTNVGISRFTPAQDHFYNFTTADGLYEIEFNRHHHMKLPDGRIAFGGSKGYTIFHPRDFRADQSNPVTQISSLFINDFPITHLRNPKLLPEPINQLDRLDLAHDENTITMELASMQFNAPEKNKYRYRLEGYDKDWVEIGNDNRFRYSFLPAGHYTLHLNSSNTGGDWSSQIHRLVIVVHPPFWLSYWAFALYTLVAVVTLVFLWKNYNKRLMTRQELAFNLREAARLRELDETKSRFFSNITHEFRTPLTLILSPLEKYLGDASLNPQVAQTLLNNNYRHANQLLKLVNQLLDIAKLEAGQMQINPSAGELAIFIKQCTDSFRHQADERKMNFNVFIEGIDGHYLFDLEKWEKIILNLLSNAFKFTPDGGTVMLSAKQVAIDSGLAVEIKVEDSGIGISEENLQNIFQRFYQVDDAATRKHEGTGIGLALVKELIDLIKGRIDVKSIPHKGTTFLLELPIQKLNTIPEAKEVTSINNFNLRTEEIAPGIEHDVPVILIVEDNDELRSFVKQFLMTNWTVFEASNAFEGWTIIERELPEIVISDLMMPGMSGLELCLKTKGDLRTNHINFILLTAKAAHESKIEGLKSGADEYLTKPFHIHELELRIRNLLQEQFNLRKHLEEKILPSIPVIDLPKVSDAFLNNLQSYVDKHLDNTALSVEMIAEAMAMSKSTLNRKLKALVNVSLNEYVRQYRLQKASILLQAGNSVSEVAYRVGFESPSYFAQSFKEAYKQTPSEFARLKG